MELKTVKQITEEGGLEELKASVGIFDGMDVPENELMGMLINANARKGLFQIISLLNKEITENPNADFFNFAVGCEAQIKIQGEKRVIKLELKII